MVLEWVVPAILFMLGLWVFFVHRRMARMREAAIATWAPLEVALRQRHDLAAPLVQVVLAHAPKQKRLTDALLRARNTALRTDHSPEAAGNAEIQLASAMQRVLDLARTEPELGADATFRRIQIRVTQLDEEIAAARDAFNEAALSYNRTLLGVPAVLIAKYANIHLLEYFAIEGKEREAMRHAALGRTP